MRVVIQLTETSLADKAPPAVEDMVARVGGTDLRPAHLELPGVWTFNVPDGVEPTAVIGELRLLPEVDQADVDVMSGSS